MLPSPTLRNAALAALALLAPLGLCAGAAKAQCAFDASSPVQGEVIRTAEPDMNIQFNVELELKDVRLLGPDNTRLPLVWSRPTEEVRETRFHAAKPLAPGRYMIEWDGYVRRHYHPDGGSITFMVAAADGSLPSPAEGLPAAPAPRDAQGGRYRALLGAAGQRADR